MAETDKAELTPAWRRAHAGSGITSRLILSYIERQAGRPAVEAVLRKAGLEDQEDRLRDENTWFSFETKLDLWRAAEEVLDDEHTAEHVGAAVLEFTVGTGLKRALRALGTPDFVYRNVVRANGKFNWAHRLEIVERGERHVRLRYTDISGVGYHRYDCEYTKGLLTTIPQLFGLPAARVAHTACGARGAGHCEFEISWTNGAQRLKRTALAVAAGSGVLAGVGALLAPALIPVAAAVFAVAELGVAARMARYVRRRIRALEARVGEQDDAADRLLASLGSLSSDLRLDEVLDQITAKAQSAVGGKEFALLLASGDSMRADRHSGISTPSLEALERWANHRRRALAEQDSIVIDDLTAVQELAGLPQDGKLPLGSMCAVPLRFRDQMFGVLIALAHGSTVFLPGDTAALSAYAAHAAIALSNATLVDRLERQAAEDPLTGLANRRAFRSACEAEFSRVDRGGGLVSIVVLDLDHFKSINDAQGHARGDEVLCDVGDALRASVRPHDTVARMGGEEFAILLPGADAEAAYDVAERARSAVAGVSTGVGTLSSSLGVATAGAGFDAEELLALADGACYEAKRLGRGRTVSSSIGGPLSVARPA